MKYEFDQKEIDEKINIIELEDLEFECDFIEGEGLFFNAYGTAIVDGEKYSDFQVEIILENDVEPKSATDIINADWQEYEYIFPV